MTLFWNSSKAELNAVVGYIALAWCILHFFSLPSVEDTITLVSLTIFIILWSARYLGWKVDAVCFLTKTSYPIFKFDALLNFLSSSGFCFAWSHEVVLHAASTYIWVCLLLVVLVLSLHTCSNFGDDLVYLQVDPCWKLRRKVTQGH